MKQSNATTGGYSPAANRRKIMTDTYSDKIDVAPEGIPLMTKIDDAKGCSNETTLIRQGNLWFYPDMSMYVYYRPTHWRMP